MNKFVFTIKALKVFSYGFILSNNGKEHHARRERRDRKYDEMLLEKGTKCLLCTKKNT